MTSGPATWMQDQDGPALASSESNMNMKSPLADLYASDPVSGEPRTSFQYQSTGSS